MLLQCSEVARAVVLRQPTRQTWTASQHNGPNHLGLWIARGPTQTTRQTWRTLYHDPCNEFIVRVIDIIISDCGLIQVKRSKYGLHPNTAALTTSDRGLMQVTQELDAVRARADSTGAEAAMVKEQLRSRCSTAFHRPSTALPWTFTALPLPFHCLSSTFRCPSLDLHCSSLALSLPFIDRPLPFPGPSLLFPCPFTAFP